MCVSSCLNLAIYLPSTESQQLVVKDNEKNYLACPFLWTTVKHKHGCASLSTFHGLESKDNNLYAYMRSAKRYTSPGHFCKEFLVHNKSLILLIHFQNMFLLWQIPCRENPWQVCKSTSPSATNISKLPYLLKCRSCHFLIILSGGNSLKNNIGGEVGVFGLLPSPGDITLYSP